MLAGVIKSFADKRTAAIFQGRFVRGLPQDMQARARTKLLMIDAAEDVLDLRTPPGNRLEALKGDRARRYSIRINDQWRVCFAWTDDNAHEVEIVDYH